MEGNSISARDANEGGKKRLDCKTEDENGDRSLPDCIVMDEILPRLPVKSLIRFQSVSKFWLAYISKDPYFAQCYLNLSSLFRRKFFILNHGPGCCGMEDIYMLLPYQECSDQKDLQGLGDGQSSCDLEELNQIVDSCNGLVCLYHQEDDDCMEDWERNMERKCEFGLWNPSISQYYSVVSPPGLYVAFAFGFGYVPFIDDYKIVSAFGSMDLNGIDVFRGFYVFALRSGKWRKLFGGFEYFCSSRYSKWSRIKGVSDGDQKKEKLAKKLEGRGLWNDGILYWIVRNCIVGFDLATEEFKEYTTSNEWSKNGYNSKELFRLKGCLALCGSKEYIHDFWVLRDCNDWGSWQKVSSIDMENSPFITLSETGRCLVVLHSNHLKLVDLWEESLGFTRGDEHFPHGVEAIDYVESLVSPFPRKKSKVGDNRKTVAGTKENSGLESDCDDDTSDDDGEDDADFSGESESEYENDSEFCRDSETDDDDEQDCDDDSDNDDDNVDEDDY